MATRNVTLTLDDDLVRRTRVYAAQRELSFSMLVADLLTGVVGSDGYQDTWDKELAYMSSSPMRIGSAEWSREDLHSR